MKLKKVEKSIVRFLYVPTHLLVVVLRSVLNFISGRGKIISVVQGEEELHVCRRMAIMNVNRYNELAPKFGAKQLKIYSQSGIPEEVTL